MGVECKGTPGLLWRIHGMPIVLASGIKAFGVGMIESNLETPKSKLGITRG